MNPEVHIPSELQERRQWVGWRYEKRNGDITKVPCDPGSNHRASSTNADTWSTYEQANAACKSRGLDGIGFVFTPSDPYCGVDLDNCRDPETGQIEGWAEKIIVALDSYTEVSPTGTGIHIIVKGSLPPVGRKRGRFECYDAGRFFTITGKHLDGTPYEIKAQNETLGRVHQHMFAERAEIRNGYEPRENTRHSNELPDAEIISRAKGAKNGEKFARLWRGEINGHTSHSEADLALCSCLAFWTGGDAEMIDHLFRQSGLYRPKWDERRGTHTYGEATIDKALEEAGQFYNPKSQSPYSDGIRDAREDEESMGKDERPRLQSLRFNEIPESGPRRYLLDGLIPEGHPTLLHGDGGSAKSMLVLSFGLAVARQGERT